MSGSNDDGAKDGAANKAGRPMFVNSGTRGGENDGRTIASRQDALREALSAVNNALETEDADEAITIGNPVAKPDPEVGKDAAADATKDVARDMRGGPPSAPKPQGTAQNEETDARGGQPSMTGPKTQIVRGPRRPTRTDFHQEPVVAWLVVIGGPGLGAFRPLFTGNNTVGRATTNRVPIDFGDDSISSQEQAYVRYDASDREFLFVPNLSKTNVVSINDQKPTSAVRLRPMDVITMGQTQLVFVPFCGEDFDWSELADLES